MRLTFISFNKLYAAKFAWLNVMREMQIKFNFVATHNLIHLFFSFFLHTTEQWYAGGLFTIIIIKTQCLTIAVH